MRLSFRTMLMAIVGAAGLALLLLIVAGTVIEREVEDQLGTIQARYLPRLELGPQLEAQFEGLRRGLQDAVASHELDALAATRAHEERLLAALAAAREAIAPAQAVALRDAIESYYALASEVSRRLIAGETGEALVEKMSAMQAAQTQAADLLKQATRFDRGELTRAFGAATQAQARAARYRLVISVACLGAVLLLSLWLSRAVLRSLAALAAGLRNFGRGDFSQPIEVPRHDELGVVAQQANQMADSLRRLGDERDRTSWIKEGQAGLAHELRGELEPADVADRAVRFLARYLEAPAAALYLAGPEGTLSLLGRYGFSSAGEGAVPREIAGGEGLVGQAARQEELLVVADPPADYLRVRSALGEGSPRALVLLPLPHMGRVAGVLELASFRPWPERGTALLQQVRETVAIALEVARARRALHESLAETQRQAQRLSLQEEELNATNEELRQTNEELKRQTEELERQRAALKQKNEALDEARRHLEQKAVELSAVSAYKSQFLANMSHELRTPLNSMLLLSNLMAENEGGNLTAKQVEFSKTINTAGKDLLVLINQVLDLAKVEAGKQDVQLEVVPLRQLVDHAQRVFGPLAQHKGLRFVAEIAPGLPESIVTDGQRVEQILNNLIGNAIKFTDRGEVSLRIGRPSAGTQLRRAELRTDRAVALSVTDTGIGIAPAHQERVFAPFEQLEAKTTRRYGGTGLGLSISREMSALLGGELHLHSVEGQGSTFVCYLPFERPATDRKAPGAVAVLPPERTPLPPLAPARPPGQAPAADQQLLVIEDDKVFAAALVEVIERQGSRALVAHDGESGLRLAAERRPSGIILDVRLPDVDGFTVMERLRAEPATAAIPVHFISAIDDSERAMAMGAVGYLVKPAEGADLARVIESLAPRGGQPTCRLLVVEGEHAVADSLLHGLEREHLEALRVTSARAALEALGNERFGCLILDLSLADVDGLAFLQTVQERCGSDAPPVIVYTGRPLSKPEAQRLEAYAETVVVGEGPATERLLDEIRLFVRRLKQGAPTRREAPPRTRTADLRLKGRRILVVDDDMRTVYALSALLRARGGEVLVADTGHAALTVLAETSDVRAVLMDIMMPEMDGYEAIRRLRQDERFKDLPVLALTAKAMKGDREKCLEAGASDYLPKPVDPDRLIELLATWLGKDPA